MNHKIKSRLIFFLLMALTVAGGIYFLPWPEAKEIILAQNAQLEKEKVNPFAGVAIEGQSAIVIDAVSGEVIYAKNDDEQLPLASITKVMTALVASQNLKPETILSVNNEALKEGGNGGLIPSRWQLANLLDFSLVTSSNGASRAVALSFKTLTDNDFVTVMNHQAAAIGLNDTYFINPTGLDVGGDYAGAYSTAGDMARLFRYILKNDSSIFAATREKNISRYSADGARFVGYNTNELVSQIPGLLASKTGFTDNAGGNLAVAFDAGLNQPYIAIVLGSSKTGRFADIKKLVDAGFQYQALGK